MGRDPRQEQDAPDAAAAEAAPADAASGAGYGLPPDMLATKLTPRPARTNLVPRPRVDRLLDQALSASLTLVSAQAGFGKTTLLAAWVAQRPRPACWLSLDAMDNDPARFLTYVIASLQRAAPGLGAAWLAPLRSPQPPAPLAVMTALVNEIARLPDTPVSERTASERTASEPQVLVLDDYHLITSTPVHGAVAFLLDNLPPNLHLVISTRSDPPIPIARLRSRGQVAEIRTDELRFTPDEAAAFLSQTMGLALSPEQVAALDERTEGWIAGLQMAALSMRDRADLDGFIRAFAGTHRYIMDFVLEEVLTREPEEVQAFLPQTSVLARLCGPLCDAVTGTSGGQAMLERLERRNLFLVPLDDDRRWYRYHHLFADLLQARLYHAGPGPVSPLLARAAAWCEQAGQVNEAVAYALRSEDEALAAGLIARHANPAMARGAIDTVWSWLTALPERTVRESAALGVVYCWVLWLRGRVEAIAPPLADAESALARETEARAIPAVEEAALLSQIATLRSFVARYDGQYAEAIARAEHGLSLAAMLPAEASAQLSGLAWLALGSSYDAAGRLSEAADAYAETVRLSRAGTNVTGTAGITFRMVGALQILGRLRDAEAALEDCWAYLRAGGLDGLPAAGILHVATGELLLERNAMDVAAVRIREGIALGKGSGRLDGAANAAAPLVRLALIREDPAGALAAIGEAESALPQPLAPLARAQMLALRARVAVWQGALADAEQAVEEALRLVTAEEGQSKVIVTLAALRVRLAQDRGDAVAELTRCLTDAEAAGRMGVAIELLILRSLALARRGAMPEALGDLERAAALAEPEGYVRLFADEGAPMASLLRRLSARPSRERGSEPPTAQYLATLLASCEAPRAASVPSALGGLIEPLTPREVEVLRLICAGASNRAIAERLVITVSAVKKHTGNILGKLGVSSRTQAMVRARELGLDADS
ncbi:MAG: LuxR C-terminal-related transcriptional regulator [Anaerolineae bacterium]